MGLLVNNMGWLVDSLCGCFHDEKERGPVTVYM